MNRRQFTTAMVFLPVLTNKLMDNITYTQNPQLKTIKPNWLGTPTLSNGAFQNHEFPFQHSFTSVLKWKSKRNPQQEEKDNDAWQMPVRINTDFHLQKDDFILPLGHATFFIRINGINIITDPILGNIPLVKRKSPLPINSSQLTKIDYILISHAHFDHCDKSSIKTICKQNPHAQILTGLGMAPLLSKWATPTNVIQEAGWYQQYDTDIAIKFAFLPSRHWSNRTFGDLNKRLWGAFVIQSGEKCIYFGGDSGYGGHFREVSELFPYIDISLIGAGAYSPRWFMSPNHQDPEHAVQAFIDTNAKQMIPFHFGTFDLSDEPLSEAYCLLDTLRKSQGLGDRIILPILGKVVRV
jgi:L-ascorbate metabolism protein UlaG (beta-lactamase superfamily)